ncbi:nSTAND1 domain-containing NTPase [Phormidium sp. CCY1219]|uniref:WD40 domain-containing protein n=1 Tax=Phormidium sp. CCY1219 TaxID=2886104 RepID=UPI002D1EBBF4|nr:hypothetical protein [Phormidium sp. CCY1219]MEB3830713.1 hypothetical protein [Phormidium sp. CCY1219]
MLRRAISFSQGQFSLIVVQCNYAPLRDRIKQQLQETLELQMQELSLQTSTNTLYQSIQAAIGEEMPQAFMVWGLESVNHLDRLFMAANQVREEFRNRFPFPLVLWMNDEVLKTFIQVAPDFESWGTTIEFSPSTEELIQAIANASDRVFEAVLQAGSEQFIANHFILSSRTCVELAFAKQDLADRGVSLDPALTASLQFVLGRDDYANDRIDSALAQYQQSLMFWQSAADSETVKDDAAPGGDGGEYPLLSLSQIALGGSPSPVIWEVSPSPYLVQQGVLLFHIALCYCRQSQLHQGGRHQYLIRARDCFKRCIKLFEAAQHPELVAQFIGFLGENLQRLEQWSALHAVAKSALKLHQTYGNVHQLAQDYGFLAEVALHRENWTEARQWAQLALSTVDSAPTPVRSQQEGLYLLLLARSQAQLGEPGEAIAHLQSARDRTNPEYDLQLYRRILSELRSLYFRDRQYLQAFEIKQEQRAIEAQFGLQAFIGAGRLHSQRHSLNPSLAPLPQPESVALEIAASGREEDVKWAIDRLGRNDLKLTVIHGESGVGKSSLLQAGLIPALKHSAIDGRNTLPIVLQVYPDWIRCVAQFLTAELQELGLEVSPELAAIQADSGQNSSDPQTNRDRISILIEQLRRNGDINLLTVLILDQFEEFFFVHTDPQQRLEFYRFLAQCLNLPFVKVIIALREDYLHYLLECDRLVNLETIDDGDILSNKIRYYLGNLSRDKARNVIESLTARSQFYLEPALIDELVEDLAGKLGEIRPIELQVVGAQLQAENITTLKRYRESGPKEKLVERFLEEVIADCGPENEKIARLVLYFLTEENGLRPLKSRAELVADLTPELSGNPEKLDLVLGIFEKAGLVFMLRELPTNRYQLVHDYLVMFIRQQEQIKASLKAVRQELNEKTQLLKERDIARDKERRAQKWLNRVMQGALTGAAVSAIALGWLAHKAFSEGQNAARAEIEAQNLASKALLLSNDEIGSLLAGVKAGRKLGKTKVPLELKMETVTRLQKAVYTISEVNRLSGHKNSVVSVSVSPQGDAIATASTDKTAILWDWKGRKLQTLVGHTDWVRDVAWSPNGKILATASLDRTVKLWRCEDGSEIDTIFAHAKGVTSVSFSPDGKYIATASQDKTVKIWTVEGQLVRTLNAHRQSVTSVSFSPDGQILATASLDKTVKLWRIDGKAIATLTGHNDAVTRVSFSPDGQAIATASADNTVKLWTPDGRLLRTLAGHTDWVLGVAFSADGETLATASQDNQVILWSRGGDRLRTLTGHRDVVWSVSFGPDGQTLLTGSSDNTVKLWRTHDRQLPAFMGHSKSVLVVGYSPTGRVLASASRDNTVKLWKPNGEEIASLQGHEDAVWNLSFSPDRELFATASEDQTVNIWSKSRQGLVRTLQGHTAPVLAVSFSPDGQILVSGSEDGMAMVWSRDGTQLRSIVAHAKGINSIGFSPDGQAIATASEDNMVKLWTREGTLVNTLAGHTDQVYSVAFSPDGDRIATASGDNTVKLWTRQGKEIATLEAHIGSVYWVSFSPDGKTLASASADKTVRLWSAEGQLLTVLEGHTKPVLSLSFSPDGKTIASASEDETVILWNLDLDNLLDRGCDWLGNYLAYNPTVKRSDRDLCGGIILQR